MIGYVLTFAHLFALTWVAMDHGAFVRGVCDSLYSPVTAGSDA